MMKKQMKKIFVLAGAMALALTLALPAFAAEPVQHDDPTVQGAPSVQAEAVDNTIGIKAIAAGLAIGIAATGAAASMGMATAKSAESIARQPEADGKIRTALMLGLVFIETAIIYALLAVILIIFVL